MSDEDRIKPKIEYPLTGYNILVKIFSNSDYELFLIINDLEYAVGQKMDKCHIQIYTNVFTFSDVKNKFPSVNLEVITAPNDCCDAEFQNEILFSCYNGYLHYDLIILANMQWNGYYKKFLDRDILANLVDKIKNLVFKKSTKKIIQLDQNISNDWLIFI